MQARFDITNHLGQAWQRIFFQNHGKPKSEYYNAWTMNTLVNLKTEVLQWLGKE